MTSKKVKAIPEGLRTLTPQLMVKDAARAIEFYKKAFKAEEISRFPGPDGKTVMHAHLRIGDSSLFVADPFGPGSTPTSACVQIYVENDEQVFKQAVQAGGKVRMPLQDAFWGDSFGQIEDPFGQLWAISRHKEDVTPEEMQKRAQKFFDRAGG